MTGFADTGQSASAQILPEAEILQATQIGPNKGYVIFVFVQPFSSVSLFKAGVISGRVCGLRKSRQHLFSSTFP